MSAASRRERARKRARRIRRREEAERGAAAAREERLARLGPLVEMYGEGSEILRAADQALRAQGESAPTRSWFARQIMAGLRWRVLRPDGSVTLAQERFGFKSETTFAGGLRAEVS